MSKASKKKSKTATVEEIEAMALKGKVCTFQSPNAGHRERFKKYLYKSNCESER